MKLASSWCFELQHIFNHQDTDLPFPHPSPAFKSDLPQRAGEGFSYMPWLILTCHWQVGTREFPAPSEAFNLLREKTIKVLVLLGRREGPAATLQLWHIKFYITKKRSDNSLCGLTLTSTLQHKFIFTLPAQTLPGISILFLCLSVHPSFRVIGNSHSICPISFPSPLRKMLSLQPLNLCYSEVWRWCICGLWLCWQNTHESMQAFPARNQTIFCFCILFASEPKAVGNCSMLTITIQLRRQSRKGVEGITSPKQTGHMWHISPFNCFCTLKGLCRFWCRWFSKAGHKQNRSCFLG